MVCHRGANLIAPEDTLAAVRAAFELGTDFVEIDVRNSVVHIPVLIQDRRVEKTTDVGGHYSRGRATQQQFVGAPGAGGTPPVEAKATRVRADDKLQVLAS